jgi:poly(3-hydroxybutyrate) depolymerase
MPQGDIEKNISLFIKQQFPAIYREDGPELVKLVEEYYKFSETQSNQHVYQQRRYFENKDIDTTLENMIIFFKKKFLAELPLKSDIIKFIVKNILDLYRSKGTARGIELFFAIFYQEFDIEIVYPSEKMAKVSDSEWRQGVYLQMFSNTGRFFSESGKEYTYFDLLSRNIKGTTSKAIAAVRSVNFFILNGIKTPVVYLDDIKGNFQKFEYIETKISGEAVTFGQINGSLSGFTPDTTSANSVFQIGVEVGNVYDVKQKDGYAGKAIVTKVTNDLTGRINYEIADGGYGYTLENTRLLVSDQSLITANDPFRFIEGERVQDQQTNTGTVIGQNIGAVGFKMDAGKAFDINSVITTTRGSNEVVITVNSGGNEISANNATSPGSLYPDTNNADDVKVSSLADTSVASVITDIVSPYVNVNINAADYGASTPMSGTASPVNLSTPLNTAFDIQDLTIGSIVGFENINPGTGYIFDVFAKAEDNTFNIFDRKNQIISFTSPGDAGIFSIGDRIQEQTTNIKGVVKAVNTEAGNIVVTPFDYYGFTGNNIFKEGTATQVFDVVAVERDYNDAAKPFGENAIINTDTSFAIGVVEEVAILQSGFGYVDYLKAGKTLNEINTFATGQGELRDANNVIIAQGTIQADKQGVTAGYWAGENSHISGYKPIDSSNPTLYYYDSGSRIQDSDYFQEYSYQIKSTLPLQEYEDLLRENVHLAGSKLFGDFIFKAKIDSTIRPRFLRMFNDQGTGSPLDLADIATLRASVTNFTSDSTFVSADHEPGGTGGLTLSASSNLNISKNWSQGFFEYEITVQMPSAGSAPYPVAILLHGAGGNGAGMISQYTSVLPGHVLIAVDGYGDTWNISNETSNGPDIEMLNDLITKLKLYNNLDATKFRILGFSNGGALALRAAVEITDSAVDVIVCGGSQTNDDQYRGGYFYYPADEELTGNAYANDGYDTIKNPIPQRKIVQYNGRNDNVVPYNGGAFVGLNFLSAADSAFAFAQAQGFSGSQSSGTSYGTDSFLVDYGDVIFLNDAVGHTTSADHRNLINKYLEDNYNITY